MNTKNYSTPEVEILTLMSTDIITTSGEDTDDYAGDLV